MSSPVEIRYTWDESTFLEASKATYDFEMQHASKRFIGWFFIAMTQFGVVAALKKDAFALLLISTLLVLYWYAFRWSIRRFMIKKSFQSAQNRGHHFYIRADAKGLLVSEHLLEWEKIQEVLSLKQGFLLFYESTFLYIPKSAFIGTEDKDRFSHLLKTNVVQYTRQF